MGMRTPNRTSVLAAVSLMALHGCVSIAAIEPIKNPPVNYQADISVQVEFLHPAEVGVRCAERGAAFFGVPTISSMACSNTKLVTAPNPCATLTGGWYAELLCAQIAHSNGWDPGRTQDEAVLQTASLNLEDAYGLGSAPGADYRKSKALRVEFLSPSKVGMRCASRGATAYGRPTLNGMGCSNTVMMTVMNPCDLKDAGWYADLLCHEMGHSNGWPANHPGGSFTQDLRKAPGPHIPDEAPPTLSADLLRAIELALAESGRDRVKATVIASLAGSPDEAQLILAEAGVMLFPENLLAFSKPEPAPRVSARLLTASLEARKPETVPADARRLTPAVSASEGDVAVVRALARASRAYAGKTAKSVIRASAEFGVPGTAAETLLTYAGALAGEGPAPSLPRGEGQDDLMTDQPGLIFAALDTFGALPAEAGMPDKASLTFDLPLAETAGAAATRANGEAGPATIALAAHTMVAAAAITDPALAGPPAGPALAGPLAPPQVEALIFADAALPQTPGLKPAGLAARAGAAAATRLRGRQEEGVNNEQDAPGLSQVPLSP